MIYDIYEKIRGYGITGWVIAGLVILFLVLAVIVLDVWLLGTAAAWLHGFGVWAKGFDFRAAVAQKEAARHAFSSVTWYWRHPLATAWAWLTKPSSQLAGPAVRTIWLVLNSLAVVFVAGLIFFFRMKGREKETHDRDIRKIRFKKINFDLEKEIRRTPPGQVFLGLDDHRRQVTVSWQEMTEHVHVLGRTGTGKTTFAVIPICVQAIRAGLPVVVIDFKGDRQAIQILVREAKKAGKRFYFFSLEQGKSNTYNPLASGTALSKVERIMTSLELIFEGEARFYTYCQQAVFIPLMRYFDRQSIKCTLRDIESVLGDSDLIEDITGEKISVGQIKGLTAALALYADLNIINDPEPDIDLAQVMHAGDVVYFNLKSAEAPELASGIGKMVAMDLQAQAARRTQQDRITLIAIDEFQNMACNAFKNVVSKVRDANYGLVLANQALGDLRAISEDFMNTIFNNTGTKIIFRIEDPNDIDIFARKTGWVVVPTYGSSNTKTPGIAPGVRTYGENESEYDKHNIHPNIFLTLPKGKSVIFRGEGLAVISNHTHLVPKTEKDWFERSPYPEPEPVQKQGVRTAAQEIERIKRQILERQRQDQSNCHGQPRQPGQNAGIETEDIAI